MKLSRAAIALYVGLVFASGGVLGWFGARLYVESAVVPKAIKNDPKEFRKRLIDEYTRRLNLTPDQVMKIGIILDNTLAQFNDVNQREKQLVREKDIPEFQRIRQGQVDQIRAMLTPDQRLEYEKMRDERQKQRQQNQQQKQQQKSGKGPGI